MHPHGLVEVPGTGEVDVHDPLPLLERHLLGRGTVTDAGVGEEDVDVTECLGRGSNRLGYLGLVCDVTAHGDGSPSCGLDAVGDITGRGLVDIDHGHRRAVLSEGLGDGQTQARSAAGDERGLAGQ